MNRAAMIEQLKQTQEMIAKLLSLLEASETDKFAAHLYQSRRQYRRTSERPNKGNKAIEREVLSSYQIAQSLGFNSDFRAWEHLLRIGDLIEVLLFRQLRSGNQSLMLRADLRLR
jgi:hypothetical protein